MTDLTETLAELVDTPSVTGHEGDICTLLMGRLSASWEADAVHRVGNSLVVGRRHDRPLISLYGHTDTVPRQGNGEARIEGDRMVGLGTSDMKAGLAVMIHLLEDQALRAGRYDIAGVFYAGEEGPAAGNELTAVLDHIPWLAEAEFSVVLEPTDLKVDVGCQGVINADVVFLGTAAHSARPWLGENAVTKAGQWLAEMHLREPEPVDVSGMKFREVFSITMAEGGLAKNIIPSRFVVNVNHRFPPFYSEDEAEARLRHVAAAADEVIVRDRAPGAAVTLNNAHLDRLHSLTGGELGVKQGWTDIARLNERGIPAVNFGPGESDQAHQVGESVPLDNLATAFQTLRELLAT